MAVGNGLYRLIASLDHRGVTRIRIQRNTRDNTKRDDDTADSYVFVNYLWEESRH
jgi:hypothetical protein